MSNELFDNLSMANEERSPIFPLQTTFLPSLATKIIFKQHYIFMKKY